jgi:hypothetical protein
MIKRIRVLNLRHRIGLCSILGNRSNCRDDTYPFQGLEGVLSMLDHCSEAKNELCYE